MSWYVPAKLALRQALREQLEVLVRDAARAVPKAASEQGYESPLASGIAMHGTRHPFENVDLSRGEGFGFHVGTPHSALDRVARHVDRDADPRVFMDIVAKPGRTLHTGDLGDFSNPAAWLTARTKGLTEEEAKEFHERMLQLQIERQRVLSGLKVDPTNIGDPDYDLRSEEIMKSLSPGATIRNTLLDMGVDRVQYKNAAEDPGSTSIAFLDPSKLRWASRAKFNPVRSGENNLLAGFGGGLIALPALRAALGEQMGEQLQSSDRS